MAIIPTSLLSHSLLTDEDKHTLIRPGGVSYQRNVLMFLEGILAERSGSRLSPQKSAAVSAIGVGAGRTLLSELLADNVRSESHPERLLTHEEWEIFNAKIEPWRDTQYADPRWPLTCEKLLSLLGRVRAELQRRNDAIALSRQTPKI